MSIPAILPYSMPLEVDLPFGGRLIRSAPCFLIGRGLDSIRMMSLVEKWRRVRADLTFVKLVKELTIATWWRLLSAAR